MVEWKNINNVINNMPLSNGLTRFIMLEGVDIKKRPKETEGRILFSLFDTETEILKYQGQHFVKYNHSKKEWTYRSLGDLSEHGEYAKDILMYDMNTILLKEYEKARDGL